MATSQAHPDAPPEIIVRCHLATMADHLQEAGVQYQPFLFPASDPNLTANDCDGQGQSGIAVGALVRFISKDAPAMPDSVNVEQHAISIGEQHAAKYAELQAIFRCDSGGRIPLSTTASQNETVLGVLDVLCPGWSTSATGPPAADTEDLAEEPCDIVDGAPFTKQVRAELFQHGICSRLLERDGRDMRFYFAPQRTSAAGFPRSLSDLYASQIRRANASLDSDNCDMLTALLTSTELFGLGQGFSGGSLKFATDHRGRSMPSDTTAALVDACRHGRGFDALYYLGAKEKARLRLGADGLGDINSCICLLGLLWMTDCVCSAYGLEHRRITAEDYVRESAGRKHQDAAGKILSRMQQRWRERVFRIPFYMCEIEGGKTVRRLIVFTPLAHVKPLPTAKVSHTSRYLDRCCQSYFGGRVPRLSTFETPSHRRNAPKGLLVTGDRDLFERALEVAGEPKYTHGSRSSQLSTALYDSWALVHVHRKQLKSVAVLYEKLGIHSVAVPVVMLSQSVAVPSLSTIDRVSYYTSGGEDRELVLPPIDDPSVPRTKCHAAPSEQAWKRAQKRHAAIGTQPRLWPHSPFVYSVYRYAHPKRADDNDLAMVRLASIIALPDPHMTDTTRSEEMQKEDIRQAIELARHHIETRHASCHKLPGFDETAFNDFFAAEDEAE